MTIETSSPLSIERTDAIVTVRWRRPPHNFVDTLMLRDLVDCLTDLSADHGCRAIVITGEGRSFCAGADFSTVAQSGGTLDSKGIYEQAVRLFDVTKPIVAAVNGAAIGAGAGLALAADFRLGSASTRFGFNFARLGFHPGFGISYTLPRLIGPQRAARLLYTGERVDGEAAAKLGLLDELVDDVLIVSRAQALAREIAISAPQAIASIRASLRSDLPMLVREAVKSELSIQTEQFRTEDYREGILAAQERRLPIFTGC